MTRLADLPARQPVLVLLLVGGLFVASGLGITRLETNVDFVDTVPPGPEVEAYRALLAELDGTRFVALYQPALQGVDLRSDAGFDALVREQESLTAAIEQVPGVGSSLSVYEAMRAGHYTFQKLVTLGNPDPASYSVPSDPVTYSQVRDTVRGDSGREVLAENGRSAIALFFLTTDSDRATRDAAAEVARAAEAWHLQTQDGLLDGTPRATEAPAPSGLATISQVADERTASDLATWSLVAVAATALALLLVVRRVGDIVAAAVGLLAATAAAFGAVGWLAIPVSFLTIFLAPLVTGIGMDYALHILHRNRQLREAGISARAALPQALREVGPPVALSALVAALGLLVLLGVSAPLFAQVGLLGALGIGFGLAASLTLSPALRALLPERPLRRRPDRIGAWVAATAAQLGRPRVAVPLLLLLLLVGAVGTLRVESEAGRSSDQFPQDDPNIVLQRRVEAEYGAFERGYLVVEGDIAQPDALRTLEAATQRTANRTSIRSASSIVDILRADAATDQGFADVAVASATANLPGGIVVPPALSDAGIVPSQGLPATPEEARAALDALFEDPLWRNLAPFTVARDYQLAVVAAQADPWDNAEELATLANGLRDEAALLAADLGDGYRVHAAGAPLNRDAVATTIVRDVQLAIFGAAAVVGLGLLLGWARRGWHGILAALVGIGVVLLGALLLLASIPALDGIYQQAADGGAPANVARLSQLFLLAFAVTVAVGVDGHIQVVEAAWAKRAAGLDRTEARDAAYRTVGRAVTGTALTTIAAFLPLAGLYFLQTKNLAILTAAGALYVWLLTLVATPLVAGRIGRRALARMKAQQPPSAL